MKKLLLASGWLQADETTLKVLTGKLGKGIHTGWLRYYGNDEHCVFDYTPGRDGKAADTFLAAFSGLIQVDGYTPGHRAGRMLGVYWPSVSRTLGLAV
jgi:hypothetical protein